MDISTTWNEVSTWSLDVQMELMHRLWDRMVDAGWQPELSDTQREELDRRIAEIDADPTRVVTWEQIVDHVRRKR